VTQTDFLANDPQVYYDLALELYHSVADDDEQVRLLGITITGLAAQTFENVRLPLFGQN